MADYNSKRLYNRRLTDSGANYNSAPLSIIISGSGRGMDSKEVISSIGVADTLTTQDIINLVNSSVNVTDIAKGLPSTFVSFSDISLSEISNGTTLLSTLTSSIDVIEEIGVSEIILTGYTLQFNELGQGNDSSINNSSLVTSLDNAIGAENIDLLPSSINLNHNTTVIEGISASVEMLIKNIGTGRDSGWNNYINLYNTRKLYNSRTNYNSSNHFIVKMSDSGFGHSTLVVSPISIHVNDLLSFSEDIFVNNEPIIMDSGLSDDNLLLSFNLLINDLMEGNDYIDLDFLPIFPIDSGKGIDSTLIADTFFLVDSHNILQPLGVLVTRDSRRDFLPSIREKTDTIPGKHGELYFGKDFSSKLIELHVVTKNGNSELDKLNLQRQFAKYLDATKGDKKLMFSDDLNKTYLVKYAGKINFKEYANWFPFIIPFKMSSPYIVGSFERKVIGNGTLFNEGNKETPLIIKIVGPITNPIIKIGSYILSYGGSIKSGEEVTIDTHLCAATSNLDGNVLNNINGELPYYLPPGNTSIMADSKVTTIWQSRWL